MTLFWLFMLAMGLLIPLLMVFFGRRFLKKPPSRINDFYDYRTAMSMKNAETWRFAHAVCGRLWSRVGLVLLPLSLLPFLFFIGADENRIGTVGTVVCLIQTAVLVASLIPVEAALRKNFDKDGKQRS